jgi:hypothetical protein
MNHDRWEYKVVKPALGWRLLRRWTEHATEVMNREGLQGWELVSAQWTGMELALFFKRPR